MATPDPFASGRAPLRLAHRGDARHGIENGLAAFRAAMAGPACDGVELDVRPSRDGIPMVAHDETLARLFGRTERVDALAADALEELGMARLEDVFGVLPHGAFVDVELKTDLGRSVVEVLAGARGPSLERAVVSSFDEAALRRIGELAPAWPRWLNAADAEPATIRRAVDLGCSAVAVEWHAIDARAIERARAAGLVVAAWTVTRRATAARMARLGVVAQCLEGAALDG